MTLTNAPILESENLILRGPEKKDAEKVISFLIDESRSWGFGSSPDRSDAWRWFSTNVGHWHWHGYGYFIIETNVGEVAGLSGIWNPDGWPEPKWVGQFLIVSKENQLLMKQPVEPDDGPTTNLNSQRLRVA